MAALLLIGAAGVFAYTEQLFGRRYDEPLRNALAIPADAESITEGQRLARLRGCLGGCHGKQVGGGVFIDHALMGRIVAPDLAAAVRDYSLADLDRIIRRGVLPDGRSVLVMPSAMFSQLDDADAGRIIAYLRSVQATQGVPREPARIGPVARIAFTIGMFEPEAVKLKRTSAAPASYPGPADPTYRGAYLARTLCTECHGQDLKGEGERSPDLRVAAAYSREQFAHFMRTGKALGGRELPLMSMIARGRFKHMTDDEIAALHAYLLSRAATAASPAKR